jgi:hypothetical protein
MVGSDAAGCATTGERSRRAAVSDEDEQERHGGG